MTEGYKSVENPSRLPHFITDTLFGPTRQTFLTMGTSFGKDTVAVSSHTSVADDLSAIENGKTAPITSTDLSALEDTSRDLRHDPEARAAFLATFSAEEERAIMRKVDIRFCLLIGVMFMVKNVSVEYAVGGLKDLFSRLWEVLTRKRSISGTSASLERCRRVSPETS